MSRLRANQITNENANGAPNFPHGLTVTGIVTASTSASLLSQIVVGSAVTANSQGIDVTGIVTATSFKGSGANLTSLPAQATIANNADNRVITGGSGVNLNGEANLTFNGSTLSVTGTVTDSKGDLRSIPLNSQSSAYVLVASDAGKVVYISSGGVTINENVFTAGDAVTIINNSGSAQTLSEGSGSMVLYNTADATTGNRTLAGRGMTTMMFAASDAAYISGAGLS